MLIKKAGSTGAQIHYRDIGEYLAQYEKLEILAASDINTLPWQIITPNDAGDWINQRKSSFETFTALGAKVKPGQPGPVAVFAIYSRGLETGRDVWVYNYSRSELNAAVQQMVNFYNTQVDNFEDLCRTKSITDARAHIDDFIDLDPTKISWSRSLKAFLAKRSRVAFHPEGLTVGIYRPFSKQHTYFDRHLNHERSQMPKMFPSSDQRKRWNLLDIRWVALRIHAFDG